MDHCELLDWASRELKNAFLFEEDLIRLSRLLMAAGIGDFAHHCPDREVTGITIDSRKVTPGNLFVGLPGRSYDGATFARDALSRGACSAIISDYHKDDLEAELEGLLVIERLDRKVLADLVYAFYGDISEKIRLIGVTGTNGKTTITHMVAHVLNVLGSPSRVIGTLNGELTTPESPELFSRIASAISDGASNLAMEASSIAIDQGRINNLTFFVSVFTNLTPDHLDYHGDIESYFLAKTKLFQGGRSRFCVINRDTPYGLRLLLSGNISGTSYSISDATDLSLKMSEITFTYCGRGFMVPLTGEHNLSNSLGAIEVLRLMGFGLGEISSALSTFSGVPGRLELVSGDDPTRVFVDYAHSPDALEHVLSSLKNLLEDEGRLILVFGAGGNRDSIKRSLMGEVAGRYADMVVVTNDNPRNEDPKAIAMAILAGLSDSKRDVPSVVIYDRRSAIEHAIMAAGDKDVVLIAGKGHERYQLIGPNRFEFIDGDVARLVLNLKRQEPIT